MGMPTKINSALVFRVTFSKMVLICSRQFTVTTSLKVGSGRANPNSLALFLISPAKRPISSLDLLSKQKTPHETSLAGE